MPMPMKRAVIPKPFRKIKPFKQRLKDGDIVDIIVAAELTGFSEAHLRRLCKAGKVSHEKHMSQYYFTPEDVKSVSRRVEKSA